MISWELHLKHNVNCFLKFTIQWNLYTKILYYKYIYSIEKYNMIFSDVQFILWGALLDFVCLKILNKRIIGFRWFELNKPLKYFVLTHLNRPLKMTDFNRSTFSNYSIQFLPWIDKSVISTFSIADLQIHYHINLLTI